MLQHPNRLKIVTFLLFFNIYACIGQIGCPVFQPGSPGSPNAFVNFFTVNHVSIVICFCQLTGNELKCGACKPNNWYYYTITINNVLINCYEPSVLGVDLGKYAIAAKNGWIEFDWETLSETNSSHFILEKSTNGQNPLPIKDVMAAGNSTSSIDYRFSYYEPDPEFQYYRIVQVDLDGSKEYFNWIHAAPSSLSENNLVYPNPSNGLFSLYEKKFDENSYLKVYDISGRCVFYTKVSEELTTVDTGLNQGEYTLEIHSATGSNFKRFSIRK